jgi:hypothetical protein
MANIFEEILNSIGGSGGGSVNVPQIDLPTLREIDPVKYQQIVSLNPELESAVTLGPSNFEGISTDGRLRSAQMNALAKLQQISDSGGMDDQYKADTQNMLNEVNNQNRGNQQAIAQNLATRGLSSGMSEMVQRQMAAQNASNQAASNGINIQAQAQQRALQALMNGANLGGQMQSQDFNQQSSIAQAKDAISRFNTQNQQQVQSNNVANKNNAQQWNATTAQNTANQNTEASNQAKYHNNNLPQQNYENQMKKAGMQMDADMTEQQRKEARRSGNLGFAGNLISGGMSAYGASKRPTGGTT